jgi:hypothetical protein
MRLGNAVAQWQMVAHEDTETAGIDAARRISALGQKHEWGSALTA